MVTGMLNRILHRQKLINDQIVNKMRELEMQMQLMNCLVEDLKGISGYYSAETQEKEPLLLLEPKTGVIEKIPQTQPMPC